MVFVVILALSTLGTSFASAILAKDSTTNDQNELVSKETGEALATQTTAKVIVIEKDQELARRRKLECVKQQGQATGNCNIGTLGTISEYDGQTMSRLCQDSQTVAISWQAGEGTVTRTICPGGERFHPNEPTFTYKYRGTDSVYKSNMQIKTTFDVIDLMDQADGTYELTISPIGGETSVVLCNERDVPVCATDGSLYNCADEVPDNKVLATVTQCTCGGESTMDPANGCSIVGCPDEPLCILSVCEGGVRRDSCCRCPIPTSQDDCLLDYTFNFNDGSSVCDPIRDGN